MTIFGKSRDQNTCTKTLKTHTAYHVISNQPQRAEFIQMENVSDGFVKNLINEKAMMSSSFNGESCKLREFFKVVCSGHVTNQIWSRLPKMKATCNKTNMVKT